MRYDLWAGDLEPAIQYDLTGSDPLAVGATVQFVMTQAGGSKRVVGAAVIDDPATPTVHYQWQPGDTDVPGVYRAVFRVLLGGSAPETFPSDEPIYVVIRAQL